MQRFTDIHTHTPGRQGSVLSIPADEVEQVVRMNRQNADPQYYSLQLHPWHLRGDADIDRFVLQARQLQGDPHFVAIGECGLDPLCTTPLPLQQRAFRTALQLADQLQKPVIIHCVRMWNEVIRETRDFSGQKIIHGFRKGPALAQQLLRAGFSLSLGTHYHPDVPALVPAGRLYHETDEE